MTEPLTPQRLATVVFQRLRFNADPCMAHRAGAKHIVCLPFRWDSIILATATDFRVESHLSGSYYPLASPLLPPEMPMHPKTFLLVVVCASLAIPATGDEPTPSSKFATLAKPLFLARCVDCHGEDEPEGDISLHNLDPTHLGGKDAELWGKVLEVLKFGRMPPEDEPQPSVEEVEQLTGWIQSQLAAAGKPSDIEHKLRQPGYANLLSHQKLFDGSAKGPAFGPPRLWRIHPEAYDAFLTGFGRELTMGGPLSKPFTVGEGKGLASNYAAILQADSATLGQLMLNCKNIAQLQTVGFKRIEKDRRTKEEVERLYRKPPPAFAAIMNSESPATKEQLQAAVAEEFQLVLGRQPHAQESEAFVELLRKSIQVGGKAKGLRTMAMAVLLRPEAIYRMEVGLGEKDEHGRRMLSSHELAYAIAYALTDSPPDKLMLGPEVRKRPGPPSLLDLARDGKLQTQADVRRVVTQIWENDLIEKPRILRFFHEFFGYHTAPLVFKGDRGNRAFATKHLVKDADDLVQYIVKNDRDVLKELLTTNRFFVYGARSTEDYQRRIKYIQDRIKPDRKNDANYKYFIARSEKGLRAMPQANPTWRMTVRFYNLHEDTWDYPLEQPFVMPEKQRVGILTHPAWLAAWSGNFGNDPIRRGKWIHEHLLAGSIPDVPITVDARVPEDPHKSLRDRLQVTRDSYCWQCHRKMEPLGLPLEAYNDFGQFRTQEGLGHTKALAKPKETVPVVTKGQIIASGESTLDGDVKDVHELMHRLAASKRVRQSFVRHAFRYWMGRNETMHDSPTLIAADKAYEENGGSFKAMTIELLSSDSFLYRGEKMNAGNGSSAKSNKKQPNE